MLHKVTHPSTFLPPELAFSVPVITITKAEQILIEQHYKLLHFSEEEIVLGFKSAQMRIIGENLLIQTMYPSEILLEGKILQIIFNGE